MKDIIIVGENNMSVDEKILMGTKGFNTENRVVVQDNITQFTIKKMIIKMLNSSIDKLRVVFLKPCPLMLGLLSYYNGFIDSEKDSKIKILEQKDISIFILDSDKNLIEIK